MRGAFATPACHTWTGLSCGRGPPSTASAARRTPRHMPELRIDLHQCQATKKHLRNPTMNKRSPCQKISGHRGPKPPTRATRRTRTASSAQPQQQAVSINTCSRRIATMPPPSFAGQLRIRGRLAKQIQAIEAPSRQQATRRTRIASSDHKDVSTTAVGTPGPKQPQPARAARILRRAAPDVPEAADLSVHEGSTTLHKDCRRTERLRQPPPCDRMWCSVFRRASNAASTGKACKVLTALSSMKLSVLACKPQANLKTRASSKAPTLLKAEKRHSRP